MKLRRYRAKPAPFWVRDGAPVWFTAASGARFPGFVDGRPWFAEPRAEWLVHLRDVTTACGTSRVAAVPVRDLCPRGEVAAP